MAKFQMVLTGTQDLSTTVDEQPVPTETVHGRHSQPDCPVWGHGAKCLRRLIREFG